MTSTTSFPLGLFFNATLSGPLPELTKRTSPPVQRPSLAPTEPISDEEIDELIHDFSPDEMTS